MDKLTELEVRRLVHRLGYRFRLHDTNLPGKPDLVFPPKSYPSSRLLLASA